MKSKSIWLVAALVGGAVAVGAYALRSSSARLGAPAPATSALEAIEPWCADGLEAIAGGGCFAPPRVPHAPTTMIVYLHGLYSPETVSEELDRQARVAKLGSQRGFAVLALRGTQGECTSPELKDYFCWPSNERNAADGPAFVARWSTAMDAARERLGPGSNVLLGFSNGGYFAALIVKRSLAPFDAVAIAHAGPIWVEPVRGATVPMLLITADDDASDPEMQRLDDELTQQRWPHALIAREGGHALPDWDIDSALTFFTRASKERWPLSPPLATRSRRPRVAIDGGGSAEDADVEADPGAEED